MSNINLTKSDDLNMPNESQKLVAEGLSRSLADSFNIYLKTLNYHWNVEGPKFVAIHNLTEDHYKNLAEAVDDIAENVRMRGFYAPGSLEAFSELSSIKCSSSEGKDAKAMLEDLCKDHEHIISNFKKHIKNFEEVEDSSAADLLTERKSFHEQASWMLRSLLK